MLAQTQIETPEILTKGSISLEINLAKGRFHVTVGDHTYSQTMCEFMLTFASMQGKDMFEYMSNLTSDYDFVSVPLSGSGRSVKLALSDFARLRSLYMQQMFELKLEDLLLRQGIATRPLTSRIDIDQF
jgi:hypothetical protein